MKTQLSVSDGYVAPWLQGLEGSVLPIFIASNSPLIRVVAGPGSGKTTGLKRRVQRLITGDGVTPDSIFVGTFTRAIAKELRAELELSVEFEETESAPGQLAVSTLHSLAYRLLRQNPLTCPGRNFRFIMEFEQRAMLYDLGIALGNVDSDGERRDRLSRILASWDERVELEDEVFQGALDRWLREHQGMMVSEVVRLAIAAFEDGELAPGQFDHVVIDEYQDLTKAEQELVELIWSREGSLVVLGDNDQSIYSFRHNHPGGIEEFVQRWSNAPGDLLDIEIPQNRRSQGSIVDLANRMMAQADRIQTKAPMVAVRDTSFNPDFVRWPDVDAEVNGLARYMLQESDRTFLVLVPRRFIGYRLQELLGDDAVTSFQEEVLDSHLARERLTLASLLASPDDRVALRTWLGFMGERPEEASRSNAQAYAGLANCGLAGAELVRAIATGEVKVSGRGAKNVRTRAKLLVDMWNLDVGAIEDVIEVVFDPELVSTMDDVSKRPKALRDLQMLKDASLEISESHGLERLDEILEVLRYRIATRLPLKSEAEARIKIMTLHGAKGLEADAVIIAGLADQILPGYQSGDSRADRDAREEQRRLLYVSITRARDELTISWPQAMTFRDASDNNVRRDKVETKPDGSRIVRLTRSGLLPRLGQPIGGSAWLLNVGLKRTSGDE